MTDADTDSKTIAAVWEDILVESDDDEGGRIIERAMDSCFAGVVSSDRQIVAIAFQDRSALIISLASGRGQARDFSNDEAEWQAVLAAIEVIGKTQCSSPKRTAASGLLQAKLHGLNIQYRYVPAMSAPRSQGERPLEPDEPEGVEIVRMEFPDPEAERRWHIMDAQSNGKLHAELEQALLAAYHRGD